MRRRQEEGNAPWIQEFQLAGFALQVPSLMPSLESSAKLCAVPLCSVSLVPCSLQTATPCASSAWPTCGTRAACASSARTAVTCCWGITACLTVLQDTTPTTVPANVSAPYTHLQCCQELPTPLGGVPWNGSCLVEKLCPAGRVLHSSGLVFFLLVGVSQDILQPEMEHHPN